MVAERLLQQGNSQDHPDFSRRIYDLKGIVPFIVMPKYFFSNGGGQKKLADQVREWESRVQSLNRARLRVAEMHERSRQEGITNKIEAFCRKYRVTPEEFDAMSALSQEDRSDLTQILASGQAGSYQQALVLLVQLRQGQEDETDAEIDNLRQEINYRPQGGGKLGERVAKEYRAEHPWQGKTRKYVLELYEEWVKWNQWRDQYNQESDLSFDEFQRQWLLAQEGRLNEVVTNLFPFP